MKERFFSKLADVVALAKNFPAAAKSLIEEGHAAKIERLACLV